MFLQVLYIAAGIFLLAVWGILMVATAHTNRNRRQNLPPLPKHKPWVTQVTSNVRVIGPASSASSKNEAAALRQGDS